MTTYPAQKPLEARVRFHAGHLDITTSETGEATATVEALNPSDERSVEAARSARVDLSGYRLTVDVPGKGKWRGGVQVQIRLALPAGSTVNAQSGEVTLVATGELKDLVVRTGSGDIRAEQVVNLVDVKSGDTTVFVGSPRKVIVTTGNGQVTAADVHDLSFKAGAGKAVLDSSSGSVVVKGGNIALDLGAARSGEVLFETGAGNARVGVAEGTTVQLDLSSGLGDVRCELPVEDGAPAGGAALKVRLVTGMGDVVIARA